MPEQLSNDALKLAADSTARAITKKKDLNITKRNWNNFPSSEVHIPLPPRAKRKLDQWRGSYLSIDQVFFLLWEAVEYELHWKGNYSSFFWLCLNLSFW